VTLIAAAVVATLWLGFTDRLTLYIHPRYVVFTMVMAVVALALAIAATGVRAEHDHDERPRRWTAPLRVTAVALCLAVAAALVILPPATLTIDTASQRDINGSSIGAEAQSLDDVQSAGDDVFGAFTVLDWSSLLRQTADPAFYDGKSVDVTGFITPDESDPENVFYVSRFVITCCAVDAQPIGVPVYQPGWSTSLTAGDWVRVQGGFTANPSTQSSQTIALQASAVEGVAEPDEPYLF
jgi:putative membrane protein